MKNSKHIAGKALGAFFALTLSTATLKAQDSIKAPEEYPLRPMEIGLRFMPTVSSFDMRATDGGIVEGKSVLSYGFGGMLAVNFSKNIGMQAEVIYNSASQQFKDQQLERKITVNYINIPLMFSLNTSKTECVNLNMVVGPQIGLNVGSKFETTGGGGESDTITTVLAVRQGDLGFAYGAGLDICLNKERTVRFDIGFRGVYGLLDISNNSQNTTAQNYYLLDRTHIETYSLYGGLTFLF